MREGIHRIDAPLIACAVMFGKTNTVDRRVTQIDIAGSHIDLAADNHAAFRMFAFSHLAENAKIFFRRTVAVRRVDTGRLERAAVFTNFVCALFVNISAADLD